MGTLREDQYTFFITACSFLLIVRNFSDKSCRENKNSHFMFGSSPPENCVVYEIMWENT